MRFFLFLMAAAFEIGGCYLVWQAWRTGQLWLWLPAVIALGAFAWLLRNPRPMEFFPYRGRRSWFLVPDALVPVSHRQ